jgi:aminopeptidase
VTTVPDPGRFAALLCDWCLGVSPGQYVMVNSTPLADPLLAALYTAILDRDAWPVMRVSSPSWLAAFYAHARARHLDGYSAVDMADVEAIDSVVGIDAPRNAAELAGVDPTLISRQSAARRPIQEVILSQKRWAGTLWPVPALAQQAAMSEADYGAFVNRALFLDQDDPIAAWTALSAHQAKLIDKLAPAREIRIEAEGTDITLDVSGRTWINSDGKRNMPSGEVFTGPHERSAQGTISFTIPTGPRGVTVTGVRLTFEQGKVVEATAEQGQEYLDAQLATDDGARFLGEIGIGTNVGVDVPTGHILFDEKMAGTVHLAIGRSYPESGGTNVSSVHWDMICDLRQGGRITADGEDIVVDTPFGAQGGKPVL